MSTRKLSQHSLPLLLLLIFLNGCSDSDNHSDKPIVKESLNANTLERQKPLDESHDVCLRGGTQTDSGIDVNQDGVLTDEEVQEVQYLCNESQPDPDYHFNRVSTYPVCLQLDSDCNAREAAPDDANLLTDIVTAAEIVAATSDGMTLIYTDSPAQQLGFVDIAEPSAPAGLGVVALDGEPTSVAVLGDFALVGVNTSPDYVSPSGHLTVIDIPSQTVVQRIDLGGQPDSIAISPDGSYAAVVIENERDEDLENPAPPQLPAGSLVIVSLSGEPSTWSTTVVSLEGLAATYSTDPEPEYVDINDDNIAVVTLQENNHIILIDLQLAAVVHHFPAGNVDLAAVDIAEESPALVSLTDVLNDIPREPDGVAWINREFFATADEGDLHGGSRGFTVYRANGEIVYSSGNFLEHLAVRIGHYPDSRSGNKGNEPENIEIGVFGAEKLMFVASERASLIYVFEVSDPYAPAFKQVLPSAASPEGVLAIPSRNLLITASEEDDRASGMRAALTLYEYAHAPARYPTIESANRPDGTPIPWGALSGLAADPQQPSVLYAIDDSYYQKNRVFKLDTSQAPTQLIAEMYIRDPNQVLVTIDAVSLPDNQVPPTHDTRANVFDEADLVALVNEDDTVNIDPEGIAVAGDGGFWIVSEGNGTVGDPLRPVNSLNLLVKTNAEAVIERVYTLPDEINSNQLRFGFEGVTEYDGLVYVAFQRAWPGDSDARIGVLDPNTGNWHFFFYPLDEPASVYGGWVGLSDIIALGNNNFIVIERDNRAGPDAAIKKLYGFCLDHLEDGDTISKGLARDLMDDLTVEGGLIIEKIEGLALMDNGDFYIVNDNDGVEGNSGEVQLLNLGPFMNHHLIQ